MSKTYRRTETEDRKSKRNLRARTTTTELIERADDLLSYDLLSSSDAKLLTRTLRLIEGRTGISPVEFVEGMAA